MRILLTVCKKDLIIGISRSQLDSTHEKHSGVYTVLATADSATDLTALDEIWEAVGTVTPGLTASTPPTVAWHDVLAWAAPAGSQLNRPLPQTRDAEQQ